MLLTIVLLFALVTACKTVDAPVPAPSPAPPEPTPEPPIEADEESDSVTLYWAVWDSDTLSYYDLLIDAYKEIAPDVTIKLVDFDKDGWNVNILTHLIGKHDYDIINVLDIPGYTLHTGADMLYPLNDFATARGINSSDYMGIPEQLMIDGKFYALPFKCEFWVVYYNKDLFDELEVAQQEVTRPEDTQPEVTRPNNQMTFDDWSEIIKETTRGRGDSKVWGNFFQTGLSATALFGILDGRHTINDGNYDFLKPYYEAVITLENGNFVPHRSDIIKSSLEYGDMWESGKIAQLNTGTWFRADALDSGFNWGIAAYPVPAPAIYGSTFGQVTQLAIPRSARHPEEAMNFIEFVTGTQGAEILASVGHIPVLMTDAALNNLIDIPGFPKDETTRDALRPKTLIIEQPPSEQADEIRAILNEIHAEIMDRKIDIDDGIALMNERVSALLR